MTPTETKRAADVMLAWAEGRQIEMRAVCGDKSIGAWFSGESASCVITPTEAVWNWLDYEYRIKPEPREWWDVVRNDGINVVRRFASEIEANNYCGSLQVCNRIIHVREVMEEKG